MDCDFHVLKSVTSSVRLRGSRQCLSGASTGDFVEENRLPLRLSAYFYLQDS